MSNNNKIKRIFLASALSSAVIYNANIYSAAFQLNEENASNLGNAYAGRAAVAEDASTSFYNPAGLVRLGKHHQVVASGVGVLPRSSVKMRSATNIRGAALTTGDPKQDAGVFAVVPSLHLGGPICNNFFYGFSVTSPFGLATEYDKDSMMRYFATKSELKTMDFNGNLAYKVNNKWSVAAGLSAQRAEAILAAQVDIGGINPGTTSLAADGSGKNRADGWGWGYNLGVLFQPSDKTRLGLAFRSKVDHHVRGTLKVNKIPSGLVASTNLFDQNAKSSVTLPEMLSLSLWQQLSNSWDVLADVTYVHWSRFNKLVIDYPVKSSSVVIHKYANVAKYSLGANYKYNRNWTFKFGASYDESPVKDSYRTFRIPDGDRYWASFGMQYKGLKDTVIDLGYTHIFVESVKVKETGVSKNPAAGLVGHSSNARVTGSTDLLGFQVSYNIV